MGDTPTPFDGRPDELQTLHAQLSGHVDRIVETFAANEDDHTVFLTRDSLLKGAQFWSDGPTDGDEQPVLGTWETVLEPLRLPSIAVPEMDADSPMARRRRRGSLEIADAVVGDGRDMQKNGDGREPTQLVRGCCGVVWVLHLIVVG